MNIVTRNVWEKCKIQKGLQSVIHFLVVTTVQSLVIIKQMVHKILSGKCWYEDQYLTLTLWPQKAIGIIFSVKSTIEANLETIKQRV